VRLAREAARRSSRSSGTVQDATSMDHLSAAETAAGRAYAPRRNRAMESWWPPDGTCDGGAGTQAGHTRTRASGHPRVCARGAQGDERVGKSLCSVTESGVLLTACLPACMDVPDGSCTETGSHPPRQRQPRQRRTRDRRLPHLPRTLPTWRRLTSTQHSPAPLKAG
jgi:hypothetical protein